MWFEITSMIQIEAGNDGSPYRCALSLDYLTILTLLQFSTKYQEH